uniref:Otubain n=1 Tax=Angiostrongylus cantonensis TaxID=6313 RepID=A0A0K0D3B7_ANGCA
MDDMRRIEVKKKMENWADRYNARVRLLKEYDNNLVPILFPSLSFRHILSTTKIKGMDDMRRIDVKKKMENWADRYNVRVRLLKEYDNNLVPILFPSLSFQ